MILLLDTSSPDAYVGYIRDGKVCAEITWNANRLLSVELLAVATQLLQRIDAEMNDIKAIVIYRGPGSYTGLRIGFSLANTLGYALDIPIVAGSGSQWRFTAQKEYQNYIAQQPYSYALPEYGGTVHVTQPVK